MRILFLFAMLAVVLFGCKEPEPVKPEYKPVAEFVYAMNFEEKENDAVAIKNISTGELDLGGFTLGNKANPNAYTFPANTIIKYNDSRKFTYDVFKFEIMNNDSTEFVILKNKEGKTEDIWEYK